MFMMWCGVMCCDMLRRDVPIISHVLTERVHVRYASLRFGNSTDLRHWPNSSNAADSSVSSQITRVCACCLGSSRYQHLIAASIILFCQEWKSWRQVLFLQIPQLPDFLGNIYLLQGAESFWEANRFSASQEIPGDPSEFYPTIYTWVFTGASAIHRARILVAARVIRWQYVQPYKLLQCCTQPVSPHYLASPYP